jgi:hypothetical protein
LFCVQVLRQLPLDRRFPTGEEGITGSCYFELSEAEISEGAESVAHEVALDADPRIRFLVELSGLESLS